MDREEIGRMASVEGFANEHIAVGILMKKFQNVSLVDLPLSSYDIIIARKLENGKEDIIRAQVKTARKSISFRGGTRGGVDRTYKSGVKEYTQSHETSDIVIGVTPLPDSQYDLYFIPSLLIEMIGQKSISINKVQFLKNNFEVISHCKEQDFIKSLYKEYLQLK